MNSFVGIDYSMTSPAICVMSDKQLNFYYWTTKRKYECKVELDNCSLEGILFNSSNMEDEERFNYLSEEIVTKSLWHWPKKITLEDYSYASTGRAFHIGENVGVLKHKFFTKGVKLQTIPPTVIKKFATGKGNADKQMMQDAFIERTGLDIKSLLQQNENHWNPSSDIIDAYWIALYGSENG